MLKRFIYGLYCVVIIAALYFRAFIPREMILPVYLIFFLIPQLIFLYFEVREVAESIRAYRKIFSYRIKYDSLCRKEGMPGKMAERADSCHVLLSRARINPTRAGPAAV